jgi:hypothetical protein
MPAREMQTLAAFTEAAERLEEERQCRLSRHTALTPDQARHALFELEDAILRVFTAAEVAAAVEATSLSISPDASDFVMEKLLDEIGIFKSEYRHLVYGEPRDGEEAETAAPEATEVTQPKE